MDYNHLYVEEMLRTCTTCVQLLCIANGLPLLFLFWIPSASGLRGYSLKIFLFALALLFYGVTMGGFLGMLANQGPEVFLLEAIVAPAVTLVGALACIAACFLPTLIAVREKRASKGWIIFLNCFFLIPLCWLGGFIWACMSDKSDQAGGRIDNAIANTVDTSPVPVSSGSAAVNVVDEPGLSGSAGAIARDEPALASDATGSADPDTDSPVVAAMPPSDASKNLMESQHGEEKGSSIG